MSEPPELNADPPLDPGPAAVGTWSGGRFMRFGEPVDDERFLALIAPDESIPTVITGTLRRCPFARVTRSITAAGGADP